MFEEFDDTDNVQLATRLKHELKLFRSIEKEWKETSASKKAYPKGYEKFKVRVLMRNVKKGIKMIEKKNPLYLEMPTLRSVGNGQIKKVYSEGVKSASSDDEIEVTLPAVDVRLLSNNVQEE